MFLHLFIVRFLISSGSKPLNFKFDCCELDWHELLCELCVCATVFGNELLETKFIRFQNEDDKTSRAHTHKQNAFHLHRPFDSILILWFIYTCFFLRVQIFYFLLLKSFKFYFLFTNLTRFQSIKITVRAAHRT